MIRPCNSQQRKKKNTCRIVEFTVPTDHRVKLKESKKRDKLVDFARELEKLLNTQLPVIPIVITVVGIVSKGLIEGLENLEIIGRVKTIQI